MALGLVLIGSQFLKNFEIITLEPIEKCEDLSIIF